MSSCSINGMMTPQIYNPSTQHNTTSGNVLVSKQTYAIALYYNIAAAGTFWQ